MKKKFFVILAGLILTITAVIIYSLNQKSSNLSKAVSPSPPPSPTRTPTPSFEVPSSWQQFKSEKLNVKLSYPPEMELQENEDGSIRFLLLGPTQTRGTEVHDGIIINIDSGDYTQDTFKAFVDEEHSKQQNDPVITQVSQVEETTIAGLKGLEFTTVSLGEFTMYYLPKEESSYIKISVLAEDPTEADFKTVVDTILTSLAY